MPRVQRVNDALSGQVDTEGRNSLAMLILQWYSIGCNMLATGFGIQIGVAPERFALFEDLPVKFPFGVVMVFARHLHGDDAVADANGARFE